MDRVGQEVGSVFPGFDRISDGRGNAGRMAVQ
jgi:hypothetical protein